MKPNKELKIELMYIPICINKRSRRKKNLRKEWQAEKPIIILTAALPLLLLMVPTKLKIHTRVNLGDGNVYEVIEIHNLEKGILSEFVKAIDGEKLTIHCQNINGGWNHKIQTIAEEAIKDNVDVIMLRITQGEVRD